MPPDPILEAIEALKQLSLEDRPTKGREYVKAAAVKEAATLCGIDGGVGQVPSWRTARGKS